MWKVLTHWLRSLTSPWLKIFNLPRFWTNLVRWGKSLRLLSENIRWPKMTEPLSVIVYSKPSCVQCDATYSSLKLNDVPFTVVDISEDAQALEKVKSLGYQQAPVVVAGDRSWSGF